MGGNDKRYLGMRGTMLQMSIGILAGMDFLLFGYDQGVTGGLLTLTSFNKQFPQIDLSAQAVKHLTAAQESKRATAQGKSSGLRIIRGRLANLHDLRYHRCCL